MSNEIWMERLDPRLKAVPLCYLAIPGSHDSLSYSICSDNGISPDAPYLTRILHKFMGRFMRKVTYNWCVTQSLDIGQQFNRGIRYFDLRVAKKDTKYLACHGLYGMCIFKALNEIKILIDEYDEEVVILDFQHFYDFEFSDHLVFLKIFHSIFGSKICPEPDDVLSVTLNWMVKEKKQVIAVYRADIYPTISGCWSSTSWITLWPDTTNIKTLLVFLIEKLQKRPIGTGFVSQCVFTPSSKYIALHLFSTLKQKCCIKCDLSINNLWIQNQKCLEPTGVNVIIADFIDLQDFNFCNNVININYRSLKNY